MAKAEIDLVALVVVLALALVHLNALELVGSCTPWKVVHVLLLVPG